MNAPMIIKFTTNSIDCDLFNIPSIKSQITKHYGANMLGYIASGNVRMSLTVLVNGVTQIKLDQNDNYQDFIEDTVYSSNGDIYPKHIYIKDNGITGTLSIQVK